MERERRQIVRTLGLGGGLVVALAALGCRADHPAPRPVARDLDRPAAVAPGLVAASARHPTEGADPGSDSDTALVRAAHGAGRAAPMAVPPPVDAEPSAPEGDLPLPEAIAYGLRHNPRLAQLQAQVAASREGVAIAFAPFLPGIGCNSVSAACNVPILPGRAFVAASLRRGTFAYSLAEFKVQSTLTDFGRRAGNYQQAKGPGGGRGAGPRPGAADGRLCPDPGDEPRGPRVEGRGRAPAPRSGASPPGPARPPKSVGPPAGRGPGRCRKEVGSRRSAWG